MPCHACTGYLCHPGSFPTWITQVANTPKQLTQFGAEMHRQILDFTEHYARALTHFDVAEMM